MLGFDALGRLSVAQLPKLPATQIDLSGTISATSSAGASSPDITGTNTGPRNALQINQPELSIWKGRS